MFFYHISLVLFLEVELQRTACVAKADIAFWAVAPCAFPVAVHGANLSLAIGYGSTTVAPLKELVDIVRHLPGHVL